MIEVRTNVRNTLPDPFRVTVARRFIRKMRGGTQAHLVEADDDKFYVVKFNNNPQGRRVLVNDAIGSALLRHLGISTPEPVLMAVTPKFLQQNPDVSLQMGTRRVSVDPGLHFGSRYPGHPDRLAVFDWLPDLLLAGVENLGQFLGALVFDKWAANTDHRQAVFFRRGRNPDEPQPTVLMPFQALMIDQGLILNGQSWDFAAGPMHGLYSDGRVYETVCSLLNFEPWLQKVADFPEAVIAQVARSIPAEWMEGNEAQLERLLDALVRRRGHVAGLIQDCRIAKPSAFPNWKLIRAQVLGRA